MSEKESQRKKDHLVIAAKAQTPAATLDRRFEYEPLFFRHPESHEVSSRNFLGHTLNFPFWVSSMTGGTEHAFTINQNLARLCGKYKLGMGLGSCRPLLNSQERLKDFKVRSLMGSQPLYANLGIAQLEQCMGNVNSVHEMVKNVEADGIIIHLNPIQEWFQPEGDRFFASPLDTLKRFLENTTYPVIVKEVGHGMGPKSLAALLKLPIKAIEFGAFGGTNFSLLESLRGGENNARAPFIHVGHDAEEMIGYLNALPKSDKEFIISGGIKSALDGYYLLEKLKSPAVLGMAYSFLIPAMESFDSLEKYFLDLKESYLTAKSLLNIRGES